MDNGSLELVIAGLHCEAKYVSHIFGYVFCCDVDVLSRSELMWWRPCCLLVCFLSLLLVWHVSICFDQQVQNRYGGAAIK